jgi:hypothetical protein
MSFIVTAYLLVQSAVEKKGTGKHMSASRGFSATTVEVTTWLGKRKKECTLLPAVRGRQSDSTPGSSARFACCGARPCMERVVLYATLCPVSVTHGCVSISLCA